jgi:PKHD-type hydroxylase
MANYIFPPSHNFGISEHSFATWRNSFTNDEIAKIIDLCETFPKGKGTVSNEDDNQENTIRDSQIAWVPQNLETMWIYERLAWVARQLNGEFYKFDLYGFAEDLQYSIYDEKYQGHYTWHRDNGFLAHGTPPRKLTMVLQLSDPSEYEGGTLEVFTAPTPEPIEKEKGLISLFPSYTLHRVSPVTKGTRKTLVIWICGPAFK